jgi:peptidoglycan hydrolase-like protein with peptidoglycan-binding domain
VRRASAIIAAACIAASGIVLASPGLANAATSGCTGSSGYELNAGDGIAAVPTVGNATYQVDCQLAYSNDSNAVLELQKALNMCYGYDLSEDGDFGSLTQSAVEGMQSRIGVSVDGIYGPQTRTAMEFPPTEGPGCAKLHNPLEKA